MKNITELTKCEAEEIIFIIENNDDFTFEKLCFEPTIDNDNSQRVTFSGEQIIGICYRAGINRDGFLIRFEEPKVMKYLYQHNYDITDMFDKLIFDYKDLKESFNSVYDENWDMKKLIEKLNVGVKE